MVTEMVKQICPEEAKLVEQQKCLLCKVEIKDVEFKDDLSRSEFKISGWCKKCQDDMFN